MSSGNNSDVHERRCSLFMRLVQKSHALWQQPPNITPIMLTQEAQDSEATMFWSVQCSAGVREESAAGRHPA